MNYLRGAEWRRWDLHVHTPGTQKNDNYEGNTLEEKWERFYASISAYIGTGDDPLKNIAVIGITDYLSMDNYLKVVEDKKLPESVKLILPNVELRMAPISKKGPTNIHCIFDPEIAETLESRFFSNLKFSYSGIEYSADEQGLVSLGRKYSGNSSLSKDEAKKMGLEQFVITERALQHVFKMDPELREHTIVVVPNSNQDGASGITQHKDYICEDGSQLDASKRAIYQLADMIFSANPNDALYFIGRKGDSREAVISKYGSLKPCIHGSDAHSNSKLFEPDEKRYCWIKANPTFNGFKQIMYEPEDRVRISPIKPDEKRDYQVIDSVKFDNSEFQDTEICFNENLTCIIGGKSTGKSLILNNMAYSIDAAQVRKKCKLTESKFKEIDKVTVRWKDGKISEYGKQDEDHKIVYIPQTYLNRLSDSVEEETEIDKIIHEIVVSNSKINTAFVKMQNEIKTKKLEVDKRVYDFLQKYEEIVQCKEKMKNLGTREGIEKELKKLRDKKNSLTKELNLSEADIEKYDDASSKISELKRTVAELKRDIESIEAVDNPVMSVPLLSPISIQSDMLYKKSVEKVLAEAKGVWDREKVDILRVLSDDRDKKQSAIVQNQDIVDLLAGKIAENKAVAELSQQIIEEEGKLKVFQDTEKILLTLQSEFDELLEELANAQGMYLQIHQGYSDYVNESESVSVDDLEFNVVNPFRKELFCSMLEEAFDKRNLKKGVLSEIQEEYSIGKMKQLIMECLRGDLHLIKGKTNETFLRSLLSDWYNTTYQVKMDGDSIDEMSPGKKALVLLKMLINLAESKCPILIDQPEDDLDNRSIFDELIPFIKKKKLQRQIIVVTHNANVVLGGDAEEIIIANQQGKNSKNDKFRFEYRTGAIEDETYDESSVGILNARGIQQHICDILEGGKVAFDLRKNKYRM